METSCLQCGAPFYGRTDKKFCDDQCRSAYHNQLNSSFTNQMRLTHRRLRKNWRILTHYFREGTRAVEYTSIHKEGFIPDIMTGIARRGDTVIYRCYEYAYEIREDGIVYIQLSAHCRSDIDEAMELYELVNSSSGRESPGKLD